MKTILASIGLAFFLLSACNPKEVDTRSPAGSEPKQDDASADEAPIPPVNVTGTYLACEDVTDANENNLNIKCAVRDQESGRKVDITQGFDNYIWELQKKDQNISIRKLINEKTGELLIKAEGLPYEEALEIIKNSQIKLQLFKDNLSHFMSDLSLSDNSKMETKSFTVYSINGLVINNYVEGSTPLSLPSAFAPYSGFEGCYLACYSTDETDSVYPISPEIFVKGQVRVEGDYQGNICRPKAHPTEDISSLQIYKDYCAEYIPSCSTGNCWGGGDTGGWFGLQAAPQ